MELEHNKMEVQTFPLRVYLDSFKNLHDIFSNFLVGVVQSSYLSKQEKLIKKEGGLCLGGGGPYNLMYFFGYRYVDL